MSDAAKRPAESGPEQPKPKRSRFDAQAPQNGSTPAAPVANGQPAKPVANLEALRKAKELLQKQAALKAKLAKRMPAAPAHAAPQEPAAAPAAPVQAAAPPYAALSAAAAAKIAAARLGVAVPGAEAVSKPKAFQPAPLRLDELGREIDEKGQVKARLSAAVTSLKVNQKKDEKPAPPKPPPGPPKPSEESFIDPELGDRAARKLQRRRRAGFEFVQEGRFQKQAELQRLKAEFGDEAVHQARARHEAERRAAKAAPAEAVDVNLIPLGAKPAAPPAAPPAEPIPDVEWWDARLLLDARGYASAGSGVEANVNTQRITHLVEHPVPIQPPAEEPPAAPMPLFLTKKERKKLRTQRRKERESEKQELVRQGLLEPPPPKVKISNLMRVLGSEAVVDPTAIEAQVREQMAERQQAHDDRNLANKLTTAERKEKKQRKLLGAAVDGEAPSVAVYRLRALARPEHRFKVRVNAEELHMTGGAVVVTDGIAAVVAEGGPKAQKRYAKVLLQRINWAMPRPGEEDAAAPEPPESTQLPGPGAALVWQGIVRERAFEKFVVHEVRTEAAARQFLAEHGVGHYWDLAQAYDQAAA